MSMALDPYSVDVFNTLPDLQSAQADLLAHGGKEMVYRHFKPLIKKYMLQENIGIGLLHRHFELNDDEKLVEFNSISMPWEN